MQYHEHIRNWQHENDPLAHVMVGQVGQFTSTKPREKEIPKVKTRVRL